MASDLGLIPLPIKQIYAQRSRERSLSSDMVEVVKKPDLFAATCIPISASAPLLDAMPALVCIRVRNGSLILEAAADDLRPQSDHA